MTQFDAAQWYQAALQKYLDQYGDVPPPWIYSENSHPYSIQWRMGGGEDFMTIFWKWWQEQNFSEEESIAYFKKYSPPSRWLGWTCEAIWDINGLDEHEESDYTPYFEKLKSAGFTGIENFISDLENPDWT